jgi:phospholipid-binding lipoprotein MlaA
MNNNTLARAALFMATGAFLGGCATVQNPNPKDPWESYNRGMYKVNDAVDRAVIKPVAQGYQKILPTPVTTCIHNIFSNVGDVWSAANSFLQGRGHDFVNTVGRVLFNTTMGLGGCIDVATMNGAPKISNDFGTTLGVWGLPTGPYVVLPLIGPSTVRDTAGLVGDYGGNITMGMGLIDDDTVRWSLYGLYFIDKRASLLQATDTVDRIALDPYSFVRDAYLQRREAMVLGRKADSEANLPNYGQDPGAPTYHDPADSKEVKDGAKNPGVPDYGPDPGDATPATAPVSGAAGAPLPTGAK